MSWWFSRNKAVEAEADQEESVPEIEGVPPVVAGILELQQTAGNQSLQNLSSTDSLPATVEHLVASPADRERAGIRIHADDSAAKSADSIGAAAYTKGRDIYFGAGKYAPSTSEGKELFAHELAHAVTGEPGQESGQSVAAKDVVPATAPSERQAESIASTRGTVAHLGAASGAGPTAIHRAPLTEAEIAQKLHDALAGPGTDEAAIISLLTSLNRDAAKIKKVRDAYLASFKSDLEAEIRLALAGDDLSRALFLMNAPPPATAAATATVVKPGTEKHKAKVGDGEVSVRTDVEYKTGTKTYPEGFSIGYTGGKASDSRWIQFLWSEIISTQADGKEKHVAASGLAVPAGRTMDLTTNPAAPKYHVDSAKTDDPFYEAGFTNIRTSTGTTIYDRPSEFTSTIIREFEAGATKVVEKDHFDDFLIRENKTIYRVSLVVTWEYTSKTSVKRSTAFQSGTAVTGLPSEYKKALIKDYPKFDYIQ